MEIKVETITKVLSIVMGILVLVVSIQMLVGLNISSIRSILMPF